jgi:hypothetical protein
MNQFVMLPKTIWLFPSSLAGLKKLLLRPWLAFLPMLPLFVYFCFVRN